jgi:ribosome assembly protein SQT1
MDPQQDEIEDAPEYISDQEIEQEFVLNEGEDVEGEGELEDEMHVDGEQGEEITFEDDSIQGFFDHKQPVYAIDYHPLLNLVASGGGDDQTHLWDPTTGELRHSLEKHSDSVSAVAFNNDGSLVGSAGLDGVTFIHSTHDGALQCKLEGPSDITFLKWHPKGNVVVVGSEDGSCWMFNSKGDCLTVFGMHSSPVSCGCFTIDGKSVVTGSEDGSLFVWDPKGSKAKWGSSDGRFHQCPITCVAVNNENTMIVSGAQDGSLRLLNIQNGTITELAGLKDSIESIEFNKELPFVAIGSIDGVVQVLETTTYKIRYNLQHNVKFSNFRML